MTDKTPFEKFTDLARAIVNVPVKSKPKATKKIRRKRKKKKSGE